MNTIHAARWASIALVLGLTLPLVSPAQGPGGQGMGRNRPTFSEFDLNGDGKLTEQEFTEARAKRMSERAQQGYRMRNAGNAPAFQELDSNGDGVTDPDEFAAHQARRFPGR